MCYSWKNLSILDVVANDLGSRVVPFWEKQSGVSMSSSVKWGKWSALL